MATKIADLYVKLGANTEELDKSLKDASGKLAQIGDVGKKFESVGKDLSLYVTAPLVAIGAVAIKAASDVQKGVAEVVTLFGITGDEANKLSGKLSRGVAELSNEFGIAQDVLVNGLYNAISAGVPEDNVFDFMKVATQAAIAGVTDVNTAVDGITTGLNAFGLEADQAGRVADSMFAAVQGGKTTFEELSGAMFNVAPAAAAAGVSMEEVNAGIATLTASGVPTSVATTQLRAALTGLQRPSEDLNKVFQDLGYESAQVAIESEGLGFALDAVKTASGGSNGELQKLLGSSEAVAAANVIAGTSAGKFAEEMDRQAKAAGSVEAAFSVMAETTAFQMEKTKTMLTNVGVAIGNVLLPVFNKLLESIQSGLAWFNGLSDSTKEIVTYIGLFAAALGPLLLVIGKVMTAISSMGTVLTTIKVALAGVSAPVLATVAAVTALAAIGLVIYKNWEPITEWFGKKFPEATQAFTKIWDGIKSAINNAINTIQPQIDKVIKAFDNLFASDGDVMTEASAFDAYLTFFFENIRRTVSGIIDVIANVIAIVANSIANWVNVIRSAFNVISSLLRGDFSGAWTGFKDMLSGIWNTIVTNVLLAVDSILAAVSGLFGWIPGAENAISGFREKMKDMIPKEPIQASGKAVENTVKDIDTASKATTTTVKELGTTSVTAANSMATGFATAGEKVKSMADTVKDIFKTLGEETAAGKRELAFVVKLDKKTELQNEISALETALKALANDTNISINDQRVKDLQGSLMAARQELDGLATFQAFEDKLMPKFATLNKHISEITLKDLSEMRTSLTKMDVPENGKPLFDDLMKRITAVETEIGNAADEMARLAEEAELEANKIVAWSMLETELANIDKNLSGTSEETKLKNKIAAVNAAIAAGNVPIDAANVLLNTYNDELKAVTTGFSGLIAQIPNLVNTHFPNLSGAFNNAKGAAESFRQVFEKDPTKQNGKTPLENLTDGFNSVTNTINFAKQAMNDFGAAGGAALAALSIVAPQAAGLINSVLGVLNALGIDVEAILNKAINKLKELFGLEEDKKWDEKSQSGKFLDKILSYLRTLFQVYEPDFNEGVELTLEEIEAFASQLLQIRGDDFEHTMKLVSDYLREYFAEGLASEDPGVRGAYEYAISNTLKFLEQFFKGIFPGGEGYSPEEQQKFFEVYDNLYNTGTYTPLQIWQQMVDQFGEKMTRTLLGPPPAFANGGMVFGETLAIVGDNSMASIDPEVISPLSKLKSMLVEPTLAAISSMSSQGATTQVIYVTLDGRVMSEAVFQNLPEVVRMNVGSLS
jgi:TP901 family phage tail tape measure protein